MSTLIADPNVIKDLTAEVRSEIGYAGLRREFGHTDLAIVVPEVAARMIAEVRALLVGRQ